MSLKVGIIDLNCNNIFSIYGLCKNLNQKTKVIKNYKEFDKKTELIILPGVGAFSNAMQTLKNTNLFDEIYEHTVIKNKKVLGICLGMQLLFESSKEFTLSQGLGFLKGSVQILPRGKECFPNVGWRKITTKEKKLKKFNNKSFYFIHSYQCVPSENDIITSHIQYNKKKICSSVEKNNIVGTQFHPEKSAEEGLNFFRNLLK